MLKIFFVSLLMPALTFANGLPLNSAEIIVIGDLKPDLQAKTMDLMSCAVSGGFNRDLEQTPGFTKISEKDYIFEAHTQVDVEAFRGKRHLRECVYLVAYYGDGSVKSSDIYTQGHPNGVVLNEFVHKFVASTYSADGQKPIGYEIIHNHPALPRGELGSLSTSDLMMLSKLAIDIRSEYQAQLELSVTAFFEPGIYLALSGGERFLNESFIAERYTSRNNIPGEKGAFYFAEYACWHPYTAEFYIRSGYPQSILASSLFNSCTTD